MPLYLSGWNSACDAGQALTVLSRPAGSDSLQDVMTSLMAESLDSWHRLVGFNEQGEAEWEVLGIERAASFQKHLSNFSRLVCCTYLCARIDWPSLWTYDGMRFDKSGGPQDGLVLLDAGGGPVRVLEQSWKEMMQQKMSQ